MPREYLDNIQDNAIREDLIISTKSIIMAYVTYP